MTIFVCAAAALVACAARSELGVVSVASDASADGSNQDEASKQHGSDGAASVDADENDVVLVSDGHGISDAIDECVPVNGECKSNSDCCDDFCGWGNRCGAEVPPYGSPVPPP